eukprot:6456030-Amphidinium_carterae.4
MMYPGVGVCVEVLAPVCQPHVRKSLWVVLRNSIRVQEVCGPVDGASFVQSAYLLKSKSRLVGL